MRTFKEPNLSSGWKCPICKKDDISEVVLIGIYGTEEGHNMQAEQFHLSCLDLGYDKEMNVVYQKL